MPVLYAKRLRGWRFVLFNVTLGVGHVLVLFGAGIYTSLEVHVTGTFGVIPGYVTWTQTGYMLALALAFPLTGWLSRRLGDLRLVVGAFTGVGLTSAVCALTTHFYVFLAARVLLGFFGGLTIPSCQRLVLNEYPPRKRLLSISIWSLFTLTPASLGAPLGGWIADTWGWHLIFHVPAFLALSVAGITGALLYGRGHEAIRRPFDAVGFSLLAIVAVSLQTLMNLGNIENWFDSPVIIALAILIVIALAYFVLWELATPYPAVDVRLFAHRNFTIGMICLCLGFLCFQGLLTFFVVHLQLVMGYPAYQAGLVYLPLIFFLKPMAIFFHEFAKRFDARLLASLSLSGFAVAYFWISGFDRSASFAQILWPHILEGACLGGFFVPLTVIFLSGLSPKRQMRAVELASFLRIAAGAIGITLQSAILYFRSHFHQLHLFGHLSPFNPLTDELVGKFTGLGYSESAAMDKLAGMVRQQADILGMNDAFWIAGLICSALAVFVWFADPAKLPPRPPLRREVREEALEELMEEP